jgi:hypothetical protein
VVPEEHAVPTRAFSIGSDVDDDVWVGPPEERRQRDATALSKPTVGRLRPHPPAGRHVGNIFAKFGVATRSAATSTRIDIGW